MPRGRKEDHEAANGTAETKSEVEKTTRPQGRAEPPARAGPRVDKLSRQVERARPRHCPLQRSKFTSNALKMGCRSFAITKIRAERLAAGQASSGAG